MVPGWFEIGDSTGKVAREFQRSRAWTGTAAGREVNAKEARASPRAGRPGRTSGSRAAPAGCVISRPVGPSPPSQPLGGSGSRAVVCLHLHRPTRRSPERGPSSTHYPAWRALAALGSPRRSTTKRSTTDREGCRGLRGRRRGGHPVPGRPWPRCGSTTKTRYLAGGGAPTTDGARRATDAGASGRRILDPRRKGRRNGAARLRAGVVLDAPGYERELTLKRPRPRPRASGWRTTGRPPFRGAGWVRGSAPAIAAVPGPAPGEDGRRGRWRRLGPPPGKGEA